MAFETYVLLPPGIPFLPNFGLIPIRYRLTNYAVVGFVAYGLYAFGFSVLESLALGSIWMTLTAFLLFDYLYDVPLLTV